MHNHEFGSSLPATTHACRQMGCAPRSGYIVHITTWDCINMQHLYILELHILISYSFTLMYLFEPPQHATPLIKCNFIEPHFPDPDPRILPRGSAAPPHSILFVIQITDRLSPPALSGLQVRLIHLPVKQTLEIEKNKMQGRTAPSRTIAPSRSSAVFPVYYLWIRERTKALAHNEN